jgi:chemotaxis protein CheD
MVKTMIRVNVSDAKISNDKRDTIVTYSLGSCIAVSLYDPSVNAGAMLHYQLPDSKTNSDRAIQRPFMFADTGMKILIDNMISIGAKRNRMQVKIAGGATIANAPNGFDIGKRNHIAIRKIMWKNGMLIHAEDVGGTEPRNMYLDIEDGVVIVKTMGKETFL